MSHPFLRTRVRLGRILWLAAVVSASAEPVIAEFMASNTTTLKDGQGACSDWVEIHNEGNSPANLAGWKLTDSAANPSKFTFPAITLAAGQRLIVCCSSRAGSSGAATYLDPLGYPHTNFSLSAAGEYLGLIRPDGSKSTEFAPAFPPQSNDLSYGAAQPSDTLVGATTPARYVVPTNSGYDTASPDWRANTYADAAWAQAAGPGLGFEGASPLAYWPLDETAGATAAVDATGNGFDGTSSGSAAFGATGANSQTQTAVRCSSSLGKITVPYSAALNPEVFTFAATAMKGRYHSSPRLWTMFA